MFLNSRSKNGKRKDLHSFSDEELIQNYKTTRGQNYLGELFERYTHLVFGVCLKHLKDVEESKDAVMQIFEILPPKLIEFEISSFKSWLYMVGKNHCLMMLRKKKAQQKHHLEIYENSKDKFMESATFFHPNENSVKEERISLLKKGIDKLKDEQKNCIELLYLQQKSYREVADITGYDIKKVKSHIQNGKRNLRIFIENK